MRNDIRVFPAKVYWDQSANNGEGKVVKKAFDGWSDPVNTVPLSELPSGENYGVLCGGPSKLIVIDFDKGSVAESVKGLNIDTMVVRTQSGGYHVYYRCEDAHRVKSGTKLADNVDVRANGGFVVGPGSGCNTPAGYMQYRIVKGGWDSIAPVPIKLFAFLRERGFLIKTNKSFESIVKKAINERTVTNPEHVRDALRYVKTDSYSEWFSVCAALQSEGMFAEFLEWSMTQPGFVSTDDCRRQWDKVSSKRVTNGITIGTLFHMAKSNGWRKEADKDMWSETKNAGQ